MPLNAVPTENGTCGGEQNNTTAAANRPDGHHGPPHHHHVDDGGHEPNSVGGPDARPAGFFFTTPRLPHCGFILGAI